MAESIPSLLEASLAIAGTVASLGVAWGVATAKLGALRKLLDDLIKSQIEQRDALIVRALAEKDLDKRVALLERADGKREEDIAQMVRADLFKGETRNQNRILEEQSRTLADIQQRLMRSFTPQGMRAMPMAREEPPSDDIPPMRRKLPSLKDR